MSSTTFWDEVSTGARAYTYARVRETRAPLLASDLDAFLARAVAQFRTVGGYVSEAEVGDVLPRVRRYCLKLKPRYRTLSNELLFRALYPTIREWTKAHRRETRAPVDLVLLRQQVTKLVDLYRSVPGQAHDDDGHQVLIERWTIYYGRMTRVSTAGTLRPGSTLHGRSEADYHVYIAHSWARYVAERDGGTPAKVTLDRLVKETGLKRSSLRGALERHRGLPVRAATIDALPGTARDLVRALESAGIPMNRITVVATDALAEKLWPATTNPATRRKHRERLRIAARDIELADIGLHVSVQGAHTIVGRCRLLPDGPEAFIAGVVSAGKVRPIPAGLVMTRQGVWGSPEGQDAQALCRVVASHAGDEDLVRVLSRVDLHEPAEDFLRVSAVMHDAVHRDTSDWCTLVEERISGPLAGIVGTASTDAPLAIDGLRALLVRGRRDGPAAAWQTYVASGPYADRLAPAEAAPARERVRRIGKALARVQTPKEWEAAIILDIAASRPGRRSASLVLPPARRRPVGDNRTVPSQEAKPMPAAIQAPTFEPRHFGRIVVPGWLAEEMQQHWSCNDVRSAMTEFRLKWLGLTQEEANRMERLPHQTSAVAGRQGLRTILRTWGGLLARIDAEHAYAIREAVISAGEALRDHGDLVLPYAEGIIQTVVNSTYSQDRMASLGSDLANAHDRLAWELAQRDAKAATAAS